MDRIEDLLDYFSSYDVMTIKKDAYIFNPNVDGMPPKYVYLLKEGICSLQGDTKNGNSRIYLFMESQRAVGYIPVLHDIVSDYDRGYYLMAIQAKTDCIVYRVPSQDFLRAYKENEAFRDYIVRHVLMDYMKLLQNFHNQHEGSAVTKLCKLLLDVSAMEQGQIVIRNMMPYADIANYIGVHPVTVGRIMSKLYKYEYIIKMEDGRIWIKKPESMQALVNVESEMFYY